MGTKIDKLVSGLRADADGAKLGALRDTIISAAERNSFHRGPTAFFLRVVGGVVIVMCVAGGTAVAAQGAQPGSALYPVKRLTENAALALQLSDNGRLRVRRAIMERRFDEAARSSGENAFRSATEYRRAVQGATSDVSAAALRGDPEVVAGEVDSLNNMLDDQADRADGDTDADDQTHAILDDAYADGVIKTQDAVIDSYGSQFDAQTVGSQN